MAQNQPDDLVRFSDSGFVGFRLYRFRYRVYRQEQFLARSGEFWLKSGQIQSGRIHRDQALISSANGEILPDFVWDA